jgi:hypothetical protein
VRPGSTVDKAGLAEAVAAELAASDDPTPPPAIVADLTKVLADEVAARPGDVRLRLRYARSLLDRGDTTSAATQISLVLQQHPQSPVALALLQATMSATVAASRKPTSAPPTEPITRF